MAKPRKPPRKTPLRTEATAPLALAPVARRKIFVTDDPHKAYVHFLPRARALDADALEVSNLDPNLARINAVRGAEEVARHTDHLRVALPLLDLDAGLELPALTLGFMHAVDRIGQSSRAPKVSSKGGDDPENLSSFERLARMRLPRQLALAQLEVFAGIGLVPAERVIAIRKGSGPIDSARDAVAIVAMFHDYAAVIKNKHPFSDAWLESLAAHGRSLIHSLNPSEAALAPTQRSDDAVLRDAFFKLTMDSHAMLRQAGIHLWGEKGVDAHVPSLHAHLYVPPKEAPTV